MPVPFARSEVEAVARLANLELTQTELDLFARQIGDVLEYAKQVQQIDTTGVPPTASVVVEHGADRLDLIVPGLERSEALTNAPDANTQAGFFRVPRVIS
jgi:aspartyl-tRNA(Asn)/glutamyl-tRNA(Gln) amidotransferase subunit C